MMKPKQSSALFAMIIAITLGFGFSLACSKNSDPQTDSSVQNTDSWQTGQATDSADRYCPVSTRFNPVTRQCEGHARPATAIPHTEGGAGCPNTGKKLLAGVPNCAAIPGYPPPGLANPIQNPHDCCLWPNPAEFRSCYLANFQAQNPRNDQQITQLYAEQCLGW